jgi:phosphate transport system protein
MVATPRSGFDKKLSELQDNVLYLSELVVTQVLQAVQALQTYDMDAARRINSFDETINRLRYELEETCYTLLALQQPNSRDMRRIVSTVSIVTNLERMGDHAAGIARLALRMETAPCNIRVPEFDEMAAMAVASLRDAMTALTTWDKALAQAVIDRDADIDRLHKRVYDHLIKTMTKDTSTIKCATTMLWVSHNLERYADRISNICERILYLITGNLREPRHDLMP